jgi:hypothetical protein
MDKIKITLEEKANLLRAEMDMDTPIVNWDNIEILDTTGWSKEKIEAYNQNLSKLNLQKEMEKHFRNL